MPRVARIVAATMPGTTTVIDCQWHWYPRDVCEALRGRRTHPLWTPDGDGWIYEATPTERWQFPRHFVDLDVQLEIMADAGIDTIVASPVLAGDVTATEVADARELCTMYNEAFSDAQRSHPGQLYGLAVLPLQDCAAAIEVLDDALDRLGLVGLLLHSNVNGRSIAGDELRPLYAHLERRRVPVFLHPTRTYGPQRYHDHALEPPLGYMFDTTEAAMDLILSGILDDHPDLQIVHPHFGGTLPYLVDRIDVYHRLGRWHMPRPIREYLRRFHTDTVSESPGAMRMALELYGPERMLFASDFPYFPPADGVRYVVVELPPEHQVAVFSANAKRLLGLPDLAGDA
jgi:aminocarboxymuconate-semialdehyde decarboxylase